MKKRVLCVFLAVFMFIMAGCAKRHAGTGEYVPAVPETGISKAEIELDFTEMHNAIVDEMMEAYLPFFFVRKDGFDISGSNEDPKKIIVTADCLKGTTKEDADLFISYVLGSIGANASEQNFKYKAPTEVEDGDLEGTFITYSDFGSVFNEYALVLKISVEGTDYIYNTEYPAGSTIPISPRYWKE